jgi:hypothetical protein
MSSIDRFLKTSRELIGWASNLQTREKEELIKIVVGLADELTAP